ncbi:MAG: glycosyltransferase, partial [Armatimonadota bacterium]
VSGPSESLHILFICPYLPSAIRVRPFQLIRYLVKAGYRVTVAALDDRSPADASAHAELRQICEAVHLVPHPRLQAAAQALLALPTGTPLWAAWCQSPQMMHLLRSLTATQRFDVAHVEHLRAAHFAPAVGDLPCVFDAVDCITDLQRQVVAHTPPSKPRHWLAREEAVKLRRYEPAICNCFRQVTVTSQHDADALLSLQVQSPIAIIPNGVDRELPRSASSNGTTDKRFDLIFSGKMSYQANEDAALFLLNHILPRLDLLLPQLPPVSVCIAGTGPSELLRQSALRWEDRVTITGWVEDLRPFLAASRIAVCPMRIGVGIQNKVLEAMAMGLPVVATPVASRAFGRNAQNNGLRIAADAQSFANHCAELLSGDDTARHVGIAGRDYVRAFHRWDKAAELFVEQYAKVRRAG